MMEVKIKSIKDLNKGDAVKNLKDGQTYVICNRVGGIPVVVKTSLITNLQEWVKIEDGKPKKEETIEELEQWSDDMNNDQLPF